MSEPSPLPSGSPQGSGARVGPDEVDTGRTADWMLRCPNRLSILRPQGSLQAHRPCTSATCS